MAEHYREEIRTGQREPGATFPSVREIGIAWGISTNTVYRAIRQLREEGWIEVSQGRRPIVIGDPGKT